MARLMAFSRGRLAWVARVALLIAVPGTIPWRAAAQEVAYCIEPLEEYTEELAHVKQHAMNQLRQLALGMLHHENDRKCFPPPAILDGEGKAVLSWRVAILPYLGEDCKKLYGEFYLGEPWDSEHNKPLVARMPAIYRCPRSKKADAGMTVFQVPHGPTTTFPGPEGIALRKITDGTSKTIGIVEVDENHAVPWTKPEDWTFDPANPAKGLGGHISQAVFLATTLDSFVYSIPIGVRKETLLALFTRAGGEMGVIPGYLDQ